MLIRIKHFPASIRDLVKGVLTILGTATQSDQLSPEPVEIFYLEMPWTCKEKAFANANLEGKY